MPQSLQQFWKILESTARGTGPNRDAHVRRIEQKLKQLSLDDLASFKRHLNRAMAKGCTFGLMVASFAVRSHLSDDSFLDFRAWLILHGRKTFEAAVRNPDTVADVISKREVDRMSCGGLPELPTRIWLDRGADLKLYVRKAGYLKDPPVRQDWPANKDEFRRRYPVLYKSFWNPRRIKALHG